MKPSPHFIDLNTIVCVVGRVCDRGRWSFIDRSGPTAHVEMATPSSSSQSSDVTDFSTSDESDSELAASPETSLMSVSSSNGNSPMNLDTSSAESSG